MSAGPRARAPAQRRIPGRAASVRAAWSGDKRPLWLLLAVVFGASTLTLVLLGTRLTFFNDDWYFLFQRPGLTPDSLLTPHNGHLSVLLVLLYKALVELFGLGPQLPFRLVLAAAVAALGLVVYLLVSARAGRFLGLVAATLLVFLGPAWEALLFFASFSLVGSLAAGLAALLVLEEDAPRRNVAACGLLLCSIGLSDVGIPFVAAATIAIGLRRRPSQLWIPGLPAALFAAWWLSYGNEAPSGVSRSSVEHIPRYTIDAVSTGLTSIAGLNHGDSAAVLRRGHILLLVVALGLIVWWLRGGRPKVQVLIFLGAALCFWALAAANYIPGREPTASRYQLINATLLIVIAAELFRPGRVRPEVAAVIGALAVAVVASNIDALAAGYRFLRRQSAYVRTNLGALELARGRTLQDVRLYEPVANNPFLSGVSALRYYAETRAHGSPPFSSAAEIAAAPARQRQAADKVLATAYRLAPRPVPTPTSRRGCRSPERGSRAEAPLAPGGMSITNLGRAALALGVRHFAPPQLPAYTGFLASRSTARLSVPPDARPQGWRLVGGGATVLRLCVRAR